MKCWDIKRILALPTCQEICSDKEPEQIDFGKFDLGHPVKGSPQNVLLKMITSN